MRKMILTSGRDILLADGRRLPEEGEVTLREGCDTFSFGAYTAASAADCVGRQPHVAAMGLRESWELLPPEDYTAASKGAELLNWNAEMRFCPADGTALTRASDISKKCPACGKEYFPSLWPAIVVLVIKGDRALLVHARTLRNPAVQTLVAGFVETGESLEQCVVREVREETSLDVDDVRYYGSQSWPFPHQLMVGFTARYRGGEIKFADGELTSGGFFTRDSLPELPTMPSLSRMIIEDWRAGKI